MRGEKWPSNLVLGSVHGEIGERTPEQGPLSSRAVPQSARLKLLAQDTAM